MMPDRAVNDFTQSSYAHLLDTAAARFTFCRLGDVLLGDNIALWRHDIDFSPHRALALARLESERSLPATYFVLLSSPFYNPFEPGIVQILKDVAALGHDIGLHYDASLVAGDLSAQEKRMRLEAEMISAATGCPIKSFSLHNPTLSTGPALDDISHAGFINATASALRSTFEYCSDSNGCWRFRSLHEVVADTSVRRLYALTHPEWWTPQLMTPDERVGRAVDGRAASVLGSYRTFMRRYRPNARGVLDDSKSPPSTEVKS
jgi:hypothetical protein